MLHNPGIMTIYIWNKLPSNVEELDPLPSLPFYSIQQKTLSLSMSSKWKVKLKKRRLNHSSLDRDSYQNYYLFFCQATFFFLFIAVSDDLHKKYLLKLYIRHFHNFCKGNTDDWQRPRGQTRVFQFFKRFLANLFLMITYIEE
jgi:hypothetical protein